MGKDTLKNYGIALMAVAGLILISSLSYWRYFSWNLVDWIAIIVCGYTGYMLYSGKVKK